jgi:hypothetical protein
MVEPEKRRRNKRSKNKKKKILFLDTGLLFHLTFNFDLLIFCFLPTIKLNIVLQNKKPHQYQDLLTL